MAKKITKKRPAKKQKMESVRIDLSKIEYCPECASDNIFYSKMRDEIVCRDCGGIFSKLTPEQMKKYKDSLK